VFSYLIMTCYDVLALRYVQHQLAYSKIALASFIGYAFSNNIALANLTGSSIRYRFYAAWGFSPLEIVKVIGFCFVTFWLGFVTVAGVALLWRVARRPGRRRALGVSAAACACGAALGYLPMLLHTLLRASHWPSWFSCRLPTNTPLAPVW
jgi:uncharacterized membrane protein YbhN (UPF0104 family)